MSRDPLEFATSDSTWSAEMQTLGDVQHMRATVPVDRTITYPDLYPSALLTECTLVVRKRFSGTRVMCTVSIPAYPTTLSYGRIGFWLADSEHTDADGIAIPTLLRVVQNGGTRFRRWRATGELPVDRFAVGSFAVVPVFVTDSGAHTYHYGEPIDIWAVEVPA